MWNEELIISQQPYFPRKTENQPARDPAPESECFSARNCLLKREMRERCPNILRNRALNLNRLVRCALCGSWHKPEHRTGVLVGAKLRAFNIDRLCAASEFMFYLKFHSDLSLGLLCINIKLLNTASGWSSMVQLLRFCHN